jgi:hypothetical protein
MVVAYFLRKVQPVSSYILLGKSATHKLTRLLVAHFLKKTATHIEHWIELHFTHFGKCNSHKMLVASCIFLKKSVPHIENHLIVTHYWIKVQLV